MKLKLISFMLVLCLSMFMFSGIAMAAEEEDEGGIVDALPEVVVALIGIAGLIVLIISTKDVGGAVGKGFGYVKVGFACFAAAFILVAVAEVGGFEESIELIFELLALIGMVLIVYGPKKLADTLKNI